MKVRILKNAGVRVGAQMYIRRLLGSQISNARVSIKFLALALELAAEKQASQLVFPVCRESSGDGKEGAQHLAGELVVILTQFRDKYPDLSVEVVLCICEDAELEVALEEILRALTL